MNIEDATHHLSSEDSMGMPSLKLPGLGGQTEIIAGPLNCVCAYVQIWA